MPLTILVVDDDPGIRVSIRDYLEMSGYSVIAAGNGQEALSWVDEYRPHLMVTDVLMPQMDGYELVRRVRQRPDFRLIPVIFLTARNKTQERIRGYQLGADLYMPKPFELDELGAVVRNFLDRYVLMLHGPHLPSIPPEAPSPGSGRSPTEEAPTSPPLQKDPDSRISPELSGINLTKREQEVLEVLAHGLSNAQIGDRLYLSPRTIEKHVSSLLRKTDTNKRAELVRFAIENRLVE